MPPAPQPDPDLIYGLYTGVFKPQVIRLALRLDVFTPLASGARTAAEVAAGCQASPVGVAHLLNYLQAIGLLEGDTGAYRLSPSAATFLVRGEKSYAGDLILAFTGLDNWDRMLSAVRTGQPELLVEYFEQDAWLESYSSWRREKSLEMWRAAGCLPAPPSGLRLLDIACGCAIKSFSLAQTSPQVSVSCLDRAEVLVVAQDLAHRWGLDGQTRFLPADLNQADLGTAQYDGCLLGQITHYLTPQQNQSLFGRIHAALVAAGFLLLDVPMTSDQLDEDVSFLSLILWANSGGQAYRSADYQAWMCAAGFRSVEQLDSRWLKAVR